MHSAQDKELSHLAQLYANANADADAGREGRLLALLATRLESADLARLQRWFGYEAVWRAVHDCSPEKLSDFQAHVVEAGAPVIAGLAPAGGLPGMVGAPVTNSQVAMGAMGLGATLARYYNYTPVEIYLDLRTAPIGALAEAPALYETGAILGTYAGIAWTGGWAIGTAMGTLMQEYHPTLWDTIGGTANQMVENLSAAWNQITQQGNIEQGMGLAFGIGSTPTVSMETTGGDYGNSFGWETVYSAAGSGCNAGQHGGSCNPKPE
ncbi:MAG: hypothetical protein JSR59_11710, partial [Proteobacteria bacterium]|nr:hypothetical protein [Pseudomonadota bacterium]